MSILYESDDCVFVSHEKYLNELYSNVITDIERSEGSEGSERSERSESCKSNESNERTPSEGSDERNETSFIINPKLFELNVPFKRQNVEESKFSEDVEFVRDKFELFRASYFKTERNETKRVALVEPESVKSDSSAKEVAVARKRCLHDEPGEIKIKRANLVDLDNSEAVSASKLIYASSGENLLSDCFGANALNVSILKNGYLFPPGSRFYSKDVRSVRNFLTDTFDLIVVDPPWWNKAVRRKNRDRDRYDMMRNEEIRDVPISDLLSESGLLAVWCTNSAQQYDYLIKEIFPAWGVKLKSTWFWLKVTKFGEPVINFGSGSMKQPFERLVLAGAEGSIKPKLIISTPSALHSHKPPLDRILNGEHKLEIFSRYLLPGYTSFGLETLRFQDESLFVET